MTADRSLQRTIFMACKQLGLDDDARRDLQRVVTGKASLSDMTMVEMTAVLDRLKADGFTVAKPRRKASPRADLR